MNDYPQFGPSRSTPWIFAREVTEPACFAPCPYPHHIHTSELPSGPGQTVDDPELAVIRRSSWWLEVHDDE